MPEDDVERGQLRDGLDLDLPADGLEDVRARQADHPGDDGGDGQRDLVALRRQRRGCRRGRSRTLARKARNVHTMASGTTAT